MDYSMLKKLFIISFIVMNAFAFWGASYDDQIKEWKSYEDVAKWMDSKWSFDKSRQNDVHKYIKKEKKNGRDLTTLQLDEMALPVKDSFSSRKGYCGDAASLVKDALNKVNPEYKAKYIFIKNSHGKPHHWVTGFFVNDKLYVMDYGVGEKWAPMMGTHGPYNSLDEYTSFLESLNLPKFGVDLVRWRDKD